VIETLQRTAQVRKELRTSLGREASDAELAEALDLSVDKVQKLRLLLPKEDS
jgi:DNA-directed RNA polymerase specialized sigma subunit